MNAKNQHIYYGLGAAAMTIVLAVVLIHYRKSKKTKHIIDYTKFDSPDSIGSGRCIDPRLVRMLEALATKTGLPIFDWITSGVRTPYWNKKVGGVSNSSHKTPICKAVDIGIPNHSIRKILVYTAKEVGFGRIGVGNSFVHLDIDSSKSQNIAWGYPSGTPPDINPFT